MTSRGVPVHDRVADVVRLECPHPRVLHPLQRVLQRDNSKLVLLAVPLEQP